MPRIALFVPAYRQGCRIETAFSLMHDLQFICELDRRNLEERERLLRRYVGQLVEGERDFDHETATELLNCLETMEKQEFELVPIWKSTANIARSRNAAVKDAISRGCDLIYMIDADVFAPEGAGSVLAALISSMSQTGAAAVGAVVTLRKGGGVNALPAKPGEIYEAEKIGTGAMLIDLAQVAPLDGRLFDFVLTGDGSDVDTSEDLFFCNRLREAGLKVVADYTITSGHGDAGTLYTVPQQISADAAA